LGSTTVFRARKILTMNPANPSATHVAVRDGRILAVGSAEEMQNWGPHQLDDSFQDKILMPGLVEGHAHLMAGGIWNFAYVGYQDRIDPNGKLWLGVKTIEEVIDRLVEVEKTLADDQPLVAWGFDPIFLMDRRMDRGDLDEVSRKRPTVVMHSNFHLMTVNSVCLEMAEFDEDTDLDGVAKSGNGTPNGELQEMAAMFPVLHRLEIDFRMLGRSAKGIADFGKVCNRAGVTSIADLLNDLPEEDVAEMQDITADPMYPVRLHSMLNGLSMPVEDVKKRALELQAESTDKLVVGAVKIVTDGSIQGFTARIKWPGHYGGQSNGIWNIAPEQLKVLVTELHEAGVQMHIHTNGDEAIDAALDALEAAKIKNNRPDLRHVLQHVQMADNAQLRKMKQLDVLANFFSNHIYYFGDKHAALTIGPERARAMDPCKSAQDIGVPYAIHSDAPVTPLGPLFTAWCAVNRLTESGEVLGPEECISLDDALYAITIGAAYTLQMDHDIGSIEVGKFADFAVLEQDPHAVDPTVLKDIEIWGTVVGGQKLPI
jgi:predicted amidohydrolase YtcJ